MFFRFILTLFFVLCSALPANAGETDYLALLAEESEIKAIAVVTNVNKMSRNADGTFTRVTFKNVYAATPYIPKSFVGACKYTTAVGRSDPRTWSISSRARGSGSL